MSQQAKMLHIADDKPYLYDTRKETICRHCKMYKEDVNHVVNCYVVSSEFVEINEKAVYKVGDVDELNKISTMVNKFL